MPNHPSSPPMPDSAFGLMSCESSPTTKKAAILDLVVCNHPGTMSHITGLFARRAFNLEAIFVLPLPGGETSRILLQMSEEPKRAQVEKQLAKLHDVLAVVHRDDLTPEVFSRMSNQIPDALPAPMR